MRVDSKPTVTAQRPVEQPSKPKPFDTGSETGSRANDRVTISAEAVQPAPAENSSRWSNSRGLQGAVNAHSTNTREDLGHALGEDTDWLEGDIREEIDRPGRLEMRHDEGHEPGDNLTLSEWLSEGKRSGRGLKLDIKESDRTPQVMDEVSASGVPADRLMFNLGYEESKTYGPEIRERFPEAIMAINPPSEELSTAELDEMGKLADRLGGQTTFPVREDLLTDEAIGKLSQHGSVSVWNSPGLALPGERSLDERRRSLEERGVTGMIDLRGDESVLDKGQDTLKNLFEGLGL